MKKYIMALLLLMFTITGFTQTVVPSGSPNQVTDFKGGVKVEKTLNLPVTDTDAFPGQDKLGQVRISPTDSIVRYFNGADWVKVTTEENDYVTKSDLGDSINIVKNDLTLQKVIDNGSTWTGTGNIEFNTTEEDQTISFKNLKILDSLRATRFVLFKNHDNNMRAYFMESSNGNISFNNTGNTIAEIGDDTNSAIGYEALFSNTTGYQNLAFGLRSLYTNTEGYQNVALGSYALNKNITGYSNVAIGRISMRDNTTGYFNTAIGGQALFSNTTGYINLALGYNALSKNTTGHRNIALGYGSLSNVTTGNFNTAVGAQNLLALTTGAANTVIGQAVATSLTVGNYNTVIGRHWGGSDTNAADRFLSGSYNTVISPGVNESDAIGINFSTGSYNTFIGNVKNIGDNTSNSVIISDGQNNRAFEKIGASGTNDFTGGNIRLNGINIAMDNAVVHSLGNETVGGTKTFSSYSSLKAATFTTSTRFTPDAQNISDSPVSGEVYHDLLAFNAMWGAPTFQTSANGTTWTNEAVNNNLFAQKEDQQITYSATTQKYVRWTWNSAQIAYCNAKFLKINWAYLAGTYNRNVIVETSLDGTTWTIRHSSTTTNVQIPEFFNLQDNGADTYFRLTIVNNGTADTPLSAIKVLTARAGNQGRGKEYQYPYSWDSDRNIIFNGYTKTGTMRSKGAGINFANTSGVIWGGFDETGGRLTLNNAPTAGSNEAVRAVDVQFAIPSYIAVTSAYTTGTARTITANGTFTITLATAGIPDGMEYCIKNIGSGTVTLSGTIDGVSGATLTAGQVSILRKTGSTFIKIN